MADVFTFNVSLHGADNPDSPGHEEAIRCINLLKTDLNDFESVRILPEIASKPKPGVKGIGALVIGALSTEVEGEMVAVKVARSLLGSMQGKRRQNYTLKISRKKADGTEVAITIIGPASSQEEMIALFDKADDFITRQS